MARLYGLISRGVTLAVLAGLVVPARPSGPAQASAAMNQPNAGPNQPNATVFVNSGQGLGGETGRGVALGDLNGDGFVDALAANEYASIGPEANQVWLNEGDGTFVSGQQLGIADGYGVALGDLDGDDDLDAVIAGTAAGQVWVNQGGTQGGAEGTFAAGQAFGASTRYGVALGDVDNDNDLDVLLVGNANDLWLNDGSGGLSAGPALPFLFSEAAVLADMDGNGYVDAVIADSASGTTNRVYWNEGNWTPGPATFTAGAALPTGSLMHSVAVGQLDGDSLPDIFLAGAGPDQVYWNEGGRVFTTTGALPVSDNSFGVALGNVTGDSGLDVVVGNSTAEPNRVWENLGGRALTVTQEFGDEAGQYWARGLGLADLNGDSAIDLFEVTTADDRVWVNQNLPPGPAPAWQIQTVASRGDAGRGSALIIDAAGRPHISYWEFIPRPNDDDGHLVYDWWDGHTWNRSIVDRAEDTGNATALRLDSLGRPHIAYESTPEALVEQRVLYAFWDGNLWQRETLELDAEPDGFLSLALDAQDRPHISYYRGYQADLVYATRNGGQWALEVVDTAGRVGTFNSLALDTLGNPHIAYHDYDAQELKYATRSSGGPWQLSVVDGTIGTGEGASLALEASGRPHIAYERDGAVAHAWHNGATWQIETVPGAASFDANTRIVLDTNDEPHIIWSTYPDAHVWYGHRTGGTWQTQLAATNTNFGGQALAVDGNRTPHISYFHGEHKDLRYAVLTQPWRVHSIDSPGAVDPPALALTLGGLNQTPQMAYYKPTAGLVRSARYTQGAWALAGVDFINAAGAQPSLAIGNDGRPRASYYDADTQQLRYGAWNGSAWTSQVVDLNVGTGQFSTVLLQGTRPDIVYWDANVRRIRLARGNLAGDAWQFSINLAGPAPGVGSGYVSAARLSDGGIAASYYRAQGANGELRLATWDGSAWSDELIAAGLTAAAPHNALAVDAAENEPAVAYYREADQEIWYAYRAGGTWQAELVVDNVSGVSDLSLQLAVESNRRPRIAYISGNALRLAQGNDGAWTTALVHQQGGLTLNGAALGVDHRQHIAFGSSNGLKYAVTVAATAGPEPTILTPYNPVSPFAGCFSIFFEGPGPIPAAAADGPAGPSGAAAAAAATAATDLTDLEIFLKMTPLFEATSGGQHYLDLYGKHFVEGSGLLLDDPQLMWDAYGTLQNFLPGLEALVTGHGGEVEVTQATVDDALDIWQRLAAAGSTGLAADINAELAATNNLQDFVGLTFDEWALAIGVVPPTIVYLPVVVR